MKLLMIDNYDSFTYNIVQYFGELGAEVTVFRNDEVTIEAGAEISGSIIGADVQISANSQIINSILGRGAIVGHSAQIIGSVVADGEKIAEKSILRQEISLF